MPMCERRRVIECTPIRLGDQAFSGVEDRQEWFMMASSVRRLKELSSRELEILRLFGKGNDLAGIAAALCLSYKTVANNVTRIKAKLGLRHTGELVRLAIERGLTDTVAGIKSVSR
jgi:DNA-binding NarL/FixJ family response regulator